MRRLHPVSAAYRGIGLGVTGGMIGGFGGIGLAAVVDVGIVAVAPVVLAFVGFGAGAALGVARYYRFRYDVSGGNLSIHSGVLDRQERDIPLGRIQNVDIRRNLINRVFGVAVVRFETAGGSSTEGVVNAVDLSEARRLQDAVASTGSDEPADRDADAARSSEGGDSTEIGGAPAECSLEGDDEAAPTVQETPTEGTEEERELYRLSPGELFVLSLVSFRPTAPLLVIFGLPIVSDVAVSVFARSVVALGGPPIRSPEQLFALPPLDTLLVVAIGAVQLFLVTWVTSALLTANRYYEFRLSRVGEDLRYERGLLQRYSGTIPLGKVQTVTVGENVLMRQLGYASLAMETAGYGPNQGGGEAANTAIPLDQRSTVLALAEQLGPTGVPDVERPPARARRRYAVRFSLAILAIAAVLAAVDAVLFSHPWWIALIGLVATPLAGHLRWRHRGHALAAEAFLARQGFWRRQTRIVPYYRVQTAIDERTVFQRYRDLASVTADTASTASIVGGHATAHDVDEATAQSLHPRLLERLQADLLHGRDAPGAD